MPGDEESAGPPSRRPAYPSFFFTASFTRLPSAVFPPAARAASAAFITLPMSLGDVAPVSATACSTAAAISSSVTPAGR